MVRPLFIRKKISLFNFRIYKVPFHPSLFVLKRFEKLKSQVIFFPKTKIYRDKKLVDVNYEILLLKKR